MNITVDIDLSLISDIESRFDEIQIALRNKVKELGDLALNKWISNASERIKNPQKYIEAVEQGASYPNNGDPLFYSIKPKFEEKGRTNIGELLEYGFDAFDMKEKLLKGRDKVHIKFDIGAPGVMAGSGIQVPKSLFNLAKTHNYFQDYPLSKKNFPELLGPNARPNLVNERNRKYFSPLNLNNKFGQENSGVKKTIDYTWKSGKFENLTGNTKYTKSTAGQKFASFRTISKNSPADSWIHPGCLPKHIFTDMKSDMESIVTIEFQNLLKSFS
jgi:hypothetical protein